MNNTQKTITSIVAAATLIGGGVALYESYEEEISPIDWSLYDLNIPQVSLPKFQLTYLDIPQINTTTLNVPVVKNIDVETNLLDNSASLGIPEIKENESIVSPIQLTNVYESKLVTPQVVNLQVNEAIAPQPQVANLQVNEAIAPQPQVANLQVNEAIVPQSQVANLQVNEAIAPQPQVANLNMGQYEITQFTPISLQILNLGSTQFDLSKLISLNNSLNISDYSIKLFALQKPDEDLGDWINYIKDNKSFFDDKRMVDHDNKLIIPNEIVNQWKQIYKKYRNVSDVKYVPIRKKFRMITEVRTPITNKQLNILTENLRYYKSEGYDSVLYGFTNEDNVNNVLNTIKYIIKYCNMNVWLTYTGKESLKETVFMNPETYKLILSFSAPYISGYVNSWRRTSAHLWKQDEEFMNYTNHILRESNPELPIIGELYYGNSYRFQGHGNVGFEINNFKNSSGIMIVNYGFKRVDIKYLINIVLKPYIDNMPIIGCVVGQKPYYLTENQNGLDYKENMKIKHQIENSFFNNNCVGTITLSNDGRYLQTNNLSKTLYNTLSSK